MEYFDNRVCDSETCNIEDQFEEYLEKRYQGQIDWYSKRSSQNKRYYQWFQWIVIVISASLPGLIVLMPVRLEFITVLWSVALAITAAALKTFKFQENWLNYRTIAETLKKEKHYYNVEATEYATAENKKQLFVERVEALISRENSLWMVVHTKKEDKEKI
jgi:hypothetical protein